MNPIKAQIKEQIVEFPEYLSPLKVHSLKYLKYSSCIDLNDTIQIAHEPWNGVYSFAIRLFTPAKKSWISNYQKKFGLVIPKFYKDFLLITNGCSFYGLDLFGLPPSIQNENVLNRTDPEPLDLSTANVYWKNGYINTQEFFHFGGRQFSDDENIGYFIEGKNKIHAIKKDGEILFSRDTFTDFLKDELEISESIMKEDIPEDWWS
ncbi:SMI1/KNR4 family protein [Neobacillus massiliamazoniensis]|uniref:Knr4/Smi1-like domain-containing protein n=1 Tax=Neobacillus massiliamazoniensis TaxID=1499688 RepID=A0A0U1NRS6_9BACI|nr:SMI1/KNR4 family protein [Neobacillus massiliamazoniensis]CRK80760.1 hypothetical protein BN000_00648 [Neobacillus massiliamazoniensis]